MRLCADPTGRDALVWVGYALSISDVIHDVKKISTDSPRACARASALGYDIAALRACVAATE